MQCLNIKCSWNKFITCNCDVSQQAKICHDLAAILRIPCCNISVNLDKQVKSCHFERDSFFYNLPLTRFVKEMELTEQILQVTTHDKKLCRRVETEADTQWSATK